MYYYSNIIKETDGSVNYLEAKICHTQCEHRQKSDYHFRRHLSF